MTPSKLSIFHEPSASAAPLSAFPCEGEAPGWFAAALARIEHLLALPPGWDSYGAPPIDPQSANRAIDFLLRRATTETPMPAFVPTVAGGVQLEWHANGLDAEIDFSEPGETRFYWRDVATDAEEELAVAVFGARVAAERTGQNAPE